MLTSVQSDLVNKTIKIAVITRLASKSFNLTSDECLGIDAIADPSSPYYTRRPIPPMLDAQMDEIYRAFMHSMQKQILSSLKKKMLAASDRRRHWFEIYLCTLILLMNLEYLYEVQNRQLERYCAKVCQGRVASYLR